MIKKFMIAMLFVAFIPSKAMNMEDDPYEYELLTKTYYEDKLLQVKFINSNHALFLFEEKICLYVRNEQILTPRRTFQLGNFSSDCIYLSAHDFSYSVCTKEKIYTGSLLSDKSLDFFHVNQKLHTHSIVHNNKIIVAVSHGLMSVDLKSLTEGKREYPMYTYPSNLEAKNFFYDDHNNYFINLIYDTKSGEDFLVIHSTLNKNTLLPEMDSCLKITLLNPHIRKFVLDSSTGMLLVIFNNENIYTNLQAQFIVVNSDFEGPHHYGNFLSELDDSITDASICPHPGKNLLLIQYQDLHQIDLFSCSTPEFRSEEEAYYDVKKCCSIPLSSRVISSCFASPTMLSVVTEDGCHMLYRIKKAI